MEKVATDFIGRIQDNISESGMSVTGAASSSLEIEVINDNSLIVRADKHLFFVDEGVNGINNSVGSRFGYTTKRPPIEPFIAWVKARQLQSKNNPNYYGKADFEELDEEAKILSTAWAINTSVYQKGIKPKNVMNKEIPELIDDLLDELTGNAMQTVLGNLIIEIPSTPTRGATRINTQSSPNPNFPN
ncbi:hypothetical protein [Pedobacter steynii]